MGQYGGLGGEMNNDIKAAAEQVLAGSDETSIAACLDWYRERATLMAAFILSHPYGVLKPLEWDTDGDGDYVSSPVYYCVQNGCGLCWDRNDFDAQCESAEHGKRLCEQHYAAEMAKAFTTIGEAR